MCRSRQDTRVHILVRFLTFFACAAPRFRVTSHVPGKSKNTALEKGALAMAQVRRLIGVVVCLSLGVVAPARAADVITDWSSITISTIGAGAPVAGPGRLIEYAMVHIAMHDAVQAIQQRY